MNQDGISTDIIDLKFVVFDFETDGPDPKVCKVVEVGACVMAGGVIGETYDAYVNPGTQLSPDVSAIHHIIDSDIADAPTTAEAGESLANFIGYRPVVAHNAKFDNAVGQNNFYRTGDNPLAPFNLCTMRLAKHLLPKEGGYSLQRLRYRLGIGLEGTRESRAAAHAALADAELTALLLWHLIGLAMERGITSLAALQELCWSPIDSPICPFKKYKGQPWTDVPSDYISWCLINIEDLDPDLKSNMEAVIKNR